MKSRSIYLYVLAIALFTLYAYKTMLTQGMFMDGLIYSGIAKNLSQGIGSFWHPTYTATSFVDFHEHPPLMMALLGLWMKLFGTTMMAAKAYSAFVVTVIAVLIILVWRKLGHQKYTGWWPLLLWIQIPAVTHFAFYNMLEFTMLMFVLGSVLCILSSDKYSLFMHFLAGVMLSAAFLVKGFTGLFPLALPAILWATKCTDHGFARMVMLSIVMLVGLVAPIVMICLINNEAREFLDIYFHHQVVNGSKIVLVNRWYIVWRFFLHSAIPIAVAMILLISAQLLIKTSMNVKEMLLKNHQALAMFILALCGVVPMMISTKQRDFYLLTAYPFMAIALASWSLPVITRLVQTIHIGYIATVSILAMTASIVVNAANYNTSGRDRVMLRDMERILPQLNEMETISIPKAFASEYSLHGYYYLNKSVSLDTRKGHRHLLTSMEADTAGLYECGYRNVPLRTEQYLLYELNQ